jgi:hypothetical protein
MKAITKTAPHVMVLRPQSFGELVQFAQMAAKVAWVPPAFKGQPESIMLAIQMGSELGLAPMQSLQNISVVNGRPTVWGDAVIGLCRQSPVCKDVVETVSGEGEKMTATCTAIRVGSEPVVRTFSVDDAKKAGLWGKAGPWQQYPKRMLQMRARGFAVRDAFPDVLRGLITAEEAADIPVRDTFSGPTIEHGLDVASQVAAATAAYGPPATEEDMARARLATPRTHPAKPTVTQWLDALALELAAAEGSEEVDAILARSDVQTAQDKLRNGARDRLDHLLQEAIARTAADETTAPDDGVFSDPASDPFRQPVTA